MHEHELVKNALAKGQVLVICTSSSTVGNRTDAGVWLSEVAIPYYIFKENGYDVTIASVRGGPVPVDAASVAEQDSIPEVARFMADDAAMLQLHQSVPLEGVQLPSGYVVVYLAGGQAAMADMPGNKELERVVGQAAEAGRIVGTVCHGPAGLLGVKGPDGKPLVEGRTLACFTQAEEEHTGAAGAVPFQLEAKLKELGAKVEPADVNMENAVQDGTLITGQNHNSAARVATLCLEALSTSPAGPTDIPQFASGTIVGASVIGEV